MPHEIVVVRAVERRLRKLPIQVRTVSRRTHYRVVYEVQSQPPQVIIRALGTRQNFYRDLQAQKLK